MPRVAVVLLIRDSVIEDLLQVQQKPQIPKSQNMVQKDALKYFGIMRKLILN